MKTVNGFLVLLFSVIFSVCCNKEEILEEQHTEYSFETGTVRLGCTSRQYSVRISPYSDDLSVDCDAEWLILESETVDTSATVSFYIGNNFVQDSRAASVRLMLSGRQVASLEVIQEGTVSEDGNAVTDEMDRRFRVGFGYNEFLSFGDERSTTSQILNYETIKKLEDETGAVFIQDENRSIMESEFVAASSSAELSAKLEEQSSEEKGKSWLPYHKTIERYNGTKADKQTNVDYSYYRFKKIRASRYLDLGILEYMNDGNTDLFTPGFRAIYDKVSKDPSEANITALIRDYGTALVVSANIGGYLDLALAVNADIIQNEKNLSKKISEHIFWTGAGNEELTEQEKSTVLNIIDNTTLQVAGGSQKTADAIRNAVTNPVTDDRFTPFDRSLIENWLASLDGDTGSSSVRENMAVADCRLYPISMLFTDKAVRDKIDWQIASMAKSSTIYPEKNVRYCYRIDVSSEMTDFSKDGTLVRLLYIDGRPMIQICNEYIPDIKADERVTVYYPVIDGKPVFTRGLYLGDGEGNPPAAISFSGAYAYIKPITGVDVMQKQSTFYYSDGRLLIDGSDLLLQSWSKSEVKDITLTLTNFTSGQATYPIVKIASGLWTRKYMTGTMGFGKTVSGIRFVTDERMIDGILYANFFEGNHRRYTETFNKGIYGDNSCWHIPVPSDMEDLKAFLGYNLKALFKGQQSGFDAQFAGVYARYDPIRQDKDLGYYQMIHKESYSFIPFRTNSNSATVMIISPDYTVSSAPSVSARYSYYPIRLYRDVSTLKY